jgi:hypothetical protein
MNCGHQRSRVGRHILRLSISAATAASYLLAALAHATPATQVVQAHTKAWTSGDLPGLLDSLDEDARSYDRSRDPNKLGGALSSSIGSKTQFATYYKNAYAEQPPSRETITAMAAVGDLVIAAGESAQPPDFAARSQYLTAYRIQNGRIRDLWHLAWLTPAATGEPNAVGVIQQLHAARQAADEKTFLALFDPHARHFCPSAASRTLSELPCARSTDAAIGTDVIALFAVGNLVVEQSRVKRYTGNAQETIDRVSIYRIRDGRIVVAWLLGEETQARS